ncbi:MAG: tetratricopeptide repeat protein, partial [bacterium]
VSLEITKEEFKQEIPAEKQVDETITAIQSDLDILKDLSKEIEGFSLSTGEEKPSAVEQPIAEEKGAAEAPVEQKPQIKPEEVPPLEGQIADIEFLLKESEVRPSVRNFEIAKQFDDFRTNITWEIDDTKKKITLARMAIESGLYGTALSYLQDEKDKKEFWPTTIEIIGESLIKLGRYSEAIKVLGPIILLEEIPEANKTELRYLLASAYEGVGDFENALREIEHIMAINPDYRDIKEIYILLGGKIEVEKPQPVVSIVEDERSRQPAPPEVSVEETPVEPIVTAEVPIEESPYQEPDVIIEKPKEELPTKEIDEAMFEKETEVEEKIDVEDISDDIAFL